MTTATPMRWFVLGWRVKRVWHLGRLYRDGIATAKCFGYRERTYPSQVEAVLPRGSTGCKKCQKKSSE